jgi:hypothetical protein
MTGMSTAMQVLLLSQLVSVAKTVPAVNLFHNSHEGSHSICELVAERFCMPVDCSERFDAYKNADKKTNWDGATNRRGLVLLDDGVASEAGMVAAATGNVILVRTDLLRYAVSNYYKSGVHVDKIHADPQFWGARNVTSHELSIPVLTKAIDKALLHWRHKIELALALHRARRRVFFLSYERYVDGGAEYVDYVFGNARVMSTALR